MRKEELLRRRSLAALIYFFFCVSLACIIQECITLGSSSLGTYACRVSFLSLLLVSDQCHDLHRSQAFRVAAAFEM